MKLLDSLGRAAQRLGVPGSVTIELLAQCNLECRHCYVTQSKRVRLSKTRVVSLLDHLAEAGVFSLVFTGGEIALHPHLFELIEHARSRHFCLTLLTNGTLLSERHWDRLAELRPHKVQISLYGVNAATHDAITRVPGSFDKAMASVHGLRRRGIHVQLGCPLMADNIAEAPELVRFAAANGLQLGLDPQLCYTDRGEPAPLRLSATRDAMRRAYATQELRDTRPQPRERKEDEPVCGVGQAPFVECTGDVKPCQRWPVAAGNLLERDLISIWRDSREMKRARAIRLSHLQECSRCSQLSGCTICPAINLTSTNALTQPPRWFCELSHARADAITVGKKQQKNVNPTEQCCS